MDYDITPKNRLTVTDFYNDELRPYDWPQDLPDQLYTRKRQSAVTGQISDVWTFSPDKINEFRFGFSIRTICTYPQSIGEGYPAKLGMQFAKADLFPEVNIMEPAAWGTWAEARNAIQHQLMFEPSDVVTMIQAAGMFSTSAANSWTSRLIPRSGATWMPGSVNFNGVYTNSTQGDTTTGLPYADFLLGYVNSWSAANTPEFYPRMKTVQLFVQDDYQSTSQLHPEPRCALGGVEWDEREEWQ